MAELIADMKNIVVMTKKLRDKCLVDCARDMVSDEDEVDDEMEFEKAENLISDR